MAEPPDQLFEDFHGPGTPLWDPKAVSPPPEPSRRVVPVQTTNLYNDPLNGKPRGVRYDQGLVGWVDTPMFSGSTGAPLIIDVGSYSSPPTIDVRIRESSGTDCRVWEPDVPAELAKDGGSILFAVPPEVADVAGVYYAEMRVVDGGGVERAREQIILYVDRGLWLTNGEIPADVGPPKFFEIRNATRDHPAANRLLGDYEFDPAEIGHAVVAAVQRFNSDFPVLPKYWLLSTRKIPGSWRDPIRVGTLAYLFDVAATYFRRGNLPYSAGGLSVNDLAKDKDYQAMVENLKAEYTRWIKITRQTISTSAGWGSLSSGMPNRPTY